MMNKLVMVGVLLVGAGLAASPIAAQEAEKAEPEGKELLTLKQVMPELAASTNQIVNALWVDDFATVAREARAIASHAGLSKEEQERIIGTLRKETAWFSEADALVHKSALGIAEAADKKDAVKAAVALGKMQEGCAACHQAYRSRLRTK